MHARAEQYSLLDAPAALSFLINLSGKMRMLSHRIAMFILANALNADSRRQDGRLREALNEFRHIHATLKNGNPEWGISADVIEMISDDEILGQDSHETLESFIARTEILTGSGQGQDIDAFVEFVAGPLLARLNQITQHISRTLDRLHERQRQQQANSEAAIHEALVAIEKVSVSVRIIAINAATEAVRAGDFGRGFSIIAKEIRALSDRAAELVQSVRANLR